MSSETSKQNTPQHTVKCVNVRTFTSNNSYCPPTWVKPPLKPFTFTLKYSNLYLLSYRHFPWLRNSVLIPLTQSNKSVFGNRKCGNYDFLRMSHFNHK